MKNMLRRNKKKIFTIFSKILVDITINAHGWPCLFAQYEPTNPNTNKYRKI